MTDAAKSAGSPPPSNPAATVSLVAGALLCLPATGLLAVPAGVFGLLRARRIGGAGMLTARAGLILGIINLVLYFSMIAGAYGTYRSRMLSDPAIEPTKKFIMLVGSGNVGAAKALCSDTITEDQLTGTAEQIQKWGGLVKLNAATGGDYHGPQDIEIWSEMLFEKSSKIIITHWSRPNGQLLLTAYEFRDPPSTQPAATQASPLN